MWTAGSLGIVQNDYASSGAMFDDAVADRPLDGDADLVAHSLAFLSSLSWVEGRRAEAAAFGDESLSLARSMHLRGATLRPCVPGLCLSRRRRVRSGHRDRPGGRPAQRGVGRDLGTRHPLPAPGRSDLRARRPLGRSTTRSARPHSSTASTIASGSRTPSPCWLHRDVTRLRRRGPRPCLAGPRPSSGPSHRR